MNKPNRKYSIRLTEDQWREIWQCVQVGYDEHIDFHDTCSPSDADRERNMDFLQATKEELGNQLHSQLEKQ